MTVAPRALASTAANTRTEVGRSRAAAVPRATTMLWISLSIKLGITSQSRRSADRSRHWFATGNSALPITCGLRNYFRSQPRDSIVEKRQLRLATSTRPFSLSPPARSPGQPASALHFLTLPSGDSWYPSSTLAHRAARVREGLRHSQAVRRHHRKIAPDRNCLARERTPGNEVMKDRSVISNLTLGITREPSRLARNCPFLTHMSGANGHPFASAMSRSPRTGIGCS